MVRWQWPDATLVLLTGDPAVEEEAWRVGADAVFGMAMPVGLLRAALVSLMQDTPPVPSSTVETHAGSDLMATADTIAATRCR